MMTRKTIICLCLFLLTLIPHASTAQGPADVARLQELLAGSSDARTKAFQALIDRLAVEYLRLFIETKDGRSKIIAGKIVEGLEKIQTDFSDVTVTDDSYWKKVETEIYKVIEAERDAALDKTPELMTEFYADQIALLKKQVNANDGVVVLISAMKKVNKEFIDWQSKTTGTVRNAAATNVAAQANAGSSVPGWYKSISQRCREYHARKRELRRAVYGY